MRSGNPVLNEKSFERYDIYESAATMTVEGTATKTGMLLLLVVAAAAVTWNMVNPAAPGMVSPLTMPLVFGGAISGLILAVVTCFRQTWAPVTAPIYAVAEGLFLGGVSAIFEAQYPGIAFQAVCLTFGTMFAMLVSYQTGVIRASEKFKAGVAAATGGICLLYLASIVLGFFGIRIPLIHESGLIGIGFSVFVVVIAALNLVLDFDFIDQAARQGAPKYLEWFGAFGLLVTLVWLYIEILRLLAKLNSRD